jgi:hypothetical protein
LLKAYWFVSFNRRHEGYNTSTAHCHRPTIGGALQSHIT